MNFRLRFAVLFTVFVAFILSISFTAIYLLYADYRKEDFYERVKAEGLEFYDFITKISDKKQAVALKIAEGLRNNTLFHECLAVLDSTGNLYDKLPDTMHFRNDAAYLQKIQKFKEIKYIEGQRQFYCLFMPDTKMYIISSGLDIIGFVKMDNLKWILLVVFFIALMLTALFSFLFVNQAFGPLKLLSKQMQVTTEFNLTERLPEQKSNDELYKITTYFNAMLARLNNAFEMQKKFVQYASHELRTPLAVMLSQTETALNKTLSQDEFKNVLYSLKDDQIDLIELTNSLLLLSQYEKIHFSAQWPLVRIDELIFEAIDTLKKKFPMAEINFSYANFPDKEEDLSVKGKDALIKSAFLNLIKNAYIYSSNKKVSISLESINNLVEIKFENEGAVVDESAIEYLMTPFYRSSNSKHIKGFGLGLSIVQKIIELHHGKISYVPINHSLNRFIVSLPIPK
jgi:signal transduction histidine kinase